MSEGSGSRGKASIDIGGSTPNTDLETKYGVAKKPLTSPARAAWSSQSPQSLNLRISLKKNRSDMTDSTYQQ